MGLFGSYLSEREKSCPGSADGFTYFGSVSYVSDNRMDLDGRLLHEENDPNSKQVVVNDFVIPSRSTEASEQHKGRHFQIWFDEYHRNYLIKDLGIGFGVFKKMGSGAAILKDNMLVNVGEAYIVVNLLPENAEEQGRPYDILKLKMFGGPNNGEVYEFSMEDMKVIINH